MIDLKKTIQESGLTNKAIAEKFAMHKQTITVHINKGHKLKESLRVKYEDFFNKHNFKIYELQTFYKKSLYICKKIIYNDYAVKERRFTNYTLLTPRLQYILKKEL